MNELPDYVKELVAGYAFEIFECFRKILLVGMPVFFPDTGSNSKLIFGLSSASSASAHTPPSTPTRMLM